MKIKPSDLTDLIIQVHAKNYTREQAEKIAEVYVFAEATGRDTMGILKMFGTEPSQNFKPKHAPKIVKETPVSAQIDVGDACGPYGGQVALEMLLKKAKTSGFAVVGVNHTLSSTGALSFYAHKIAKANFVGIIMACSPKAVAYVGGMEPVFGTNPMAFGFPTLTHPIVFDMTTSAIPFYGLIQAKNRGEKLPENIALDKDGKPTTDPDEAIVGSLLPFDRSYKGSGLGLMVELLAGPLIGADAFYGDNEGVWGTFFMAFSPDLTGDTATFKASASDLINRLKKTKTRTGEPVHIPGYDSFEKSDEILNNDKEIDIDDALMSRLQALV